LLPLHATT